MSGSLGMNQSLPTDAFSQTQSTRSTAAQPSDRYPPPPTVMHEQYASPEAATEAADFEANSPTHASTYRTSKLPSSRAGQVSSSGSSSEHSTSALQDGVAEQSSPERADVWPHTNSAPPPPSAAPAAAAAAATAAAAPPVAQLARAGVVGTPAPIMAPPMSPTSLFPPFFGGGDGGTVTVRVSATDVGRNDIFPTCRISVGGDNLHAPLIERLFELPMDVYEGRLNGYLEIFLKTKEEWTRFPRFGGNVNVTDAAFHFWDSPDDFSGTNMDLKFDDTTCHIVSSRGRFGAAELAATGIIGINPETGEYDISAEVSPTDVNAVRATLGARPLPYPAAGAVKGQFTCYGALENPIFSGRMKTVREGAWEGAAAESVSDAQKALEASRRAGEDAHLAYDKLAIMCAL